LANRATTAASKAAANAAPKSGSQAAAKSRGRLGELRREIEQIEKRLAAIALERTLAETELCKDPMHVGLQAQHAQLSRDAAYMETRWMEVGTAIEAAEAKSGHSG
jgi:ATP-binding cassette subfamily F protein 3